MHNCPILRALSLDQPTECSVLCYCQQSVIESNLEMMLWSWFEVPYSLIETHGRLEINLAGQNRRGHNVTAT